MHKNKILIIVFLQIIIMITVIIYIFNLEISFDTQLMFLSLFLIAIVLLWTRLQIFFQKDALSYQKKKLIDSYHGPISLKVRWDVDYFHTYFSNNDYKIETIKGAIFAYKLITHLYEKKLKKPLLEIFVWLDSAESLEYGIMKIESYFQTKGKAVRNISIITYEHCDDSSCTLVESGFSFGKTAHNFLTIIPVGIHVEKNQLHVLHSDSFFPSIYFKHAIDVIYQSNHS